MDDAHSIDKEPFTALYSRLMDAFADPQGLDWPTVFERMENALLPIFDADGAVSVVLPPQPTDDDARRRHRVYARNERAAPPVETRNLSRLSAPLRPVLDSTRPASIDDWAAAVGDGEITVFDRAMLDRRARSALALSLGEQPTARPSGVVGAIALYRSEATPFDAGQIALAERIAPLLKTIFRSAYLFQEQRIGARHTQIIHDVSAEAIAHLPTPEQLYDRVCALIYEGFEFYDVAIFQVSWGDAELCLVAHTGDYLEYEARGHRQDIHTGVLGHVARTAATYHVSDVETDPVYYNAFPGNQTIKSELTIPIKLEGNFVVAVLDIQSQEANAFDRYDIASIEALCRLIARMVQSADRYEQLGMLHILGQELQHTLDLDSLFRAILTCITAGPGFGFNRAVIFTLNERENVLEERLHIGASSGEDAHRIWSQIGNRTIEDYLEEARRQTSDDVVAVTNRYMRIQVSPEELDEVATWKGSFVVRQDQPSSSRVIGALQQLSDASEMAIIPLIARDRPIGIILADNRVTRQPITTRLLETLGAFASQAALALSNAQTYRALEVAFEELKAARTQLSQTEKLAIIGQMAAHVAHEIRNPLVNIGGFGQRIIKTTEEEETRRRAEIVVRETARLEMILKDVMDFASPLEVKSESVSLVEIVQSMTDVIAESAQEASVQILQDVAPGAPNVRGDEERLKQVVLNLAKNAIEAMPYGGDLAIRIRADDRSVRLEIADTGRGIPDDDLDRLFEPFFTTKKHGSGLGLAVTKSIIERHGGAITAESKLDEGTTFTILLPRGD